MIDFTDCPRVPGRAYNGANGKKIAVRYNGETWILKFPPNWQMFVVDAFLGNFDRHNGNWGFLTEENVGLSRLAPVFDCGSCLLPQADDNIMKKCLENENDMNARIFTFPASMLKINDRKINYYDFLHASDRPQGLVQACNLLLPRIMALNTEDLVLSTPSLSSLQQDFYINYMNRRRELLF